MTGCPPLSIRHSCSATEVKVRKELEILPFLESTFCTWLLVTCSLCCDKCSMEKSTVYKNRHLCNQAMHFFVTTGNTTAL